jgi:hypothetical protein
MSRNIKISKKVWVWPGNMSAWYFIYVDGKEKEYVDRHGKKSRNGLIKIDATVGKTTWQTSLLPYKKDNAYLIALKKQVRIKECILEGDIITVNFKLTF